MSFRDNILSRIKMCDFNKAFKDRKAKYLNLSGTTWKQLLQYLDLNLKIQTPKTVFILGRINDILNDQNQSNTETLVSNIKYMVDKCRKCDVKNVLLSGLVYTIIVF